ncbi:YkvA family protein [Hydrocarboniclastica marina]|uniref:DUF1232 domain-containing protein n=1 Tax=Hydrocarboniclastica marina TaxID=2259620 RepID=A0A4V1D8V9_9ALTE|nr:YkvA family protein [Hydrocarboniclastica marina]MAL98011.1 hypothetical protein [Alteromonadaceae bacterium]QCF26550.1 DUF1232 domain-containing protein [Hydrocarboniclastica marina]|tara:strand:- start:533 stop:907 length:375 start_codon:yes stop_codon:yes gene_type:complete
MEENKQQLLSKAVPYRKQFTEGRFRNKLRQVAQVGKRPLELSLTLYYAFRDPATPAWCKTVILGVLGYFISVVDAIPDLTPVLGYTDDVGMMIAALAVLGTHISPQHTERARARVASLLAEPLR